MSDIIDSKASTAKDKILLVSPIDLAYRLAYLLLDHYNNKEYQVFFQITRKCLEKLAKDHSAIQTMAADNVIKDKAPISEAFINCVRYELEKLGFALIKADKKYLLCSTSMLDQISCLTKDYEQFATIEVNQIKQAVNEALKPKNEQAVQSKTKPKKKVTENKQLILEDIWSILLKQAKQSLVSKAITLTHAELTKCCQYQVHQNGLASYLYSIAQYCQSRQLPRLDYLVVKEGTRLPDGIVATDINAVIDFHAQLEEIVSSVKKEDSCFQAEPSDLKFEKKSRANNFQSIQEKQLTTVTLNELLEKKYPSSNQKQ